MPDPSQQPYDVIVIGSGFGGAMAAHALVAGGARVLMLERGGEIERGADSADETWGFFQLGDAFDRETTYRVMHGGKAGTEGICACVGGPSVFYGGASFRFREDDFRPALAIVGDSGAKWPIGYADLEPFYSSAEALLGVAGDDEGDPTVPPRSEPYPRPPAPLAPISARIAEAARGMGLHPFRVPLALNDVTGCGMCDGYACAVGAKNDLAAGIIPDLVARGLDLRSRMVVTRLVRDGSRITTVEAVSRATGDRRTFRAERVVLAAGALASPHLLLASGLGDFQGGGTVIGHYLMRHCNAFVYAFFGRFPEPGTHHKQIAIHDYYSIDDAARAGRRKLGNIQQVMHPQVGGLVGMLPRRAVGHLRKHRRQSGMLARGIRRLTHHVTGLQVIAEDEPRYANRVEIDPATSDRFGLPRARIVHDYTERDLRARDELIGHARQILRRAGGRPFLNFKVKTFSHAVGTVRMGDDPKTSALDRDCRLRGIDNLYIVDGSFMPTSAAVNPSLTIAANALRVGAHLAAGQ
jgi:choline dehydrogenase-like flavoprotein